jgi:hypothetical protein
MNRLNTSTGITFGGISQALSYPTKKIIFGKFCPSNPNYDNSMIA